MPERHDEISGHHPLAGTKEGVDEVLAFRIERREIVEAVDFAGDQHAADAYFWRRFPLAPIPSRFD